MAALVARDKRARLRLLHAQADRESVAALAEEIRAHLGLEVVAQAAADDVLPDVLAAARRAGLLVIGARLANPLRDFIP